MPSPSAFGLGGDDAIAHGRLRNPRGLHLLNFILCRHALLIVRRRLLHLHHWASAKHVKGACRAFFRKKNSRRLGRGLGGRDPISDTLVVLQELAAPHGVMSDADVVGSAVSYSGNLGSARPCTGQLAGVVWLPPIASLNENTGSADSGVWHRNLEVEVGALVVGRLKLALRLAL